MSCLGLFHEDCNSSRPSLSIYTEFHRLDQTKMALPVGDPLAVKKIDRLFGIIVGICHFLRVMRLLYSSSFSTLMHDFCYNLLQMTR